MPNTDKLYKKLARNMSSSRWAGAIHFDAFIDRERTMDGETQAKPVIVEDEVEEAIDRIESSLDDYPINIWENQPKYVEVWIEKKALQGVFEKPSQDYTVGLGACKGYPSITFLYEASLRFKEARDRKQEPTILYFGDYDPTGKDIPRSVQDGLFKMGAPITLQLVALSTNQIKFYNLSSVPAKKGDTRAWNGDGVVELDAIDPKILEKMTEDAILKNFDVNKYKELVDTNKKDKEQYQEALKEFVKEL